MRFLQRLMHAMAHALKFMAKPVLDAAGRIIGWMTPAPELLPADPVYLAQEEIAESVNGPKMKMPDPVSGIRHALLLIARGEAVPHDRLGGIRDTVRNQLGSMTKEHARALLQVNNQDLERWLSTSMPPSVEINRPGRRLTRPPGRRSELGLVPVP